MKKTAIYFTHVVAARKPGFALLCGHMIDQEDDPTFTRFAVARGDNDWGYIGDLRQDIVYGLMGRPSPKVEGGTDFFALGREGTLRVMLSRQDADVDIEIPVKEKSVYLEALCMASDGLYVCGGQNQVYRYAEGQWSAQDEGIFVPFEGKLGPTLLAIAEPQPGTLLAVGTRGLALRRAGDGAWHTLDAPINLDLHAVLPTGDGGAWIGGDGGTLLRLSADGAQWRDYSHPELSTAAFDSLALHQGKLYISAMNQLLSLDTADPNATLQPVQGPFKAGSEFHSLSACDEYLWATGDEHVYRLGPGAQWQHLLCPDNA